jgi:hypothetical protein
MLECVAPRATGARSCDDWGVGHGGGGESTGFSAADRMVWVSGPSPFAGHPAASLDSVLPVGEVEPVLVANVTSRAAAVAAWTQHRFRGI